MNKYVMDVYAQFCFVTESKVTEIIKKHSRMNTEQGLRLSKISTNVIK